jgi:F-type H+-transporting ATPase subunit b
MDIVMSVLKSLDFDPITFSCQFGLFFFLHFSLNALVYQPIMKIRDSRDLKISTSLASAEEAASEARRLKSEYEEKVRGARAEGQQALQKASEAAEADRKARVEKARAEASEILKAAREEAESVLAKAAETLESQAEKVGSAIASRLLVSSLGESDGEAIMSKVGGAS